MKAAARAKLVARGGLTALIVAGPLVAPVVEIVVLWGRSMAVEGSVVGWVADHRRHHVFSDRTGARLFERAGWTTKVHWPTAEQVEAARWEAA